MDREGLPTVRIRTLDHEGTVTGTILLDPTAAQNVAGSVEVALENLAMMIDATGGVWHGGATIRTEDGWVEIAWDEGGRFEASPP